MTVKKKLIFKLNIFAGIILNLTSVTCRLSHLYRLLAIIEPSKFFVEDITLLDDNGLIIVCF